MVQLTINVTETPVGGAPAPTISSLSASANSPTTWTGSVSTDQGTGTLYYLASQNAVEDEAVIRTTGGSQAVTTAGTKTIGGGGLTAETTNYYVHVLHRNSDNKNSNILVEGPFSTPALGSGTGTVTLSLTNQTNDLIAPVAGVHVMVNVSGATVSEPVSRASHDPTVNQLDYYIDWDDSGATSSRVTNLASAHNDLSFSMSKTAGHVYTTAGTKTITAYCYEEDGTLVGSDTIQVTVQDPDTVFTGSRTILVSNAGTGDASYPGAQTETDIDDALNLVDGASQTHRILVKSGESFTMGSEHRFDNNWPNVYIGRYGGSTNYTINAASSLPKSQTANDKVLHARNSFTGDVCIWGGDFIGEWDSDTESGNLRSFYWEAASGGTRTVFYDCYFSGWGRTVLRENINNPSNVDGGSWYRDIEITNFQDYGMYIGQMELGVTFSMVGSTIYQQTDANHGANGRSFTHNQHCALRIAFCEDTHIEACDFFNRCGWGGDTLTNPTLRLNTSHAKSPFNNIYAYMQLSRSNVEGGNAIAFANAFKGTDANKGCNGLVDSCVVLGDSNGAGIFATNQSGLTVRNCIIVQPNVPFYSGRNEPLFYCNDAEAGITDTTSPIRFYNNTGLHLQNNTNIGGATMKFTEAQAEFSQNFVEDNNLLLTPNATGQPGETGTTLDTTRLSTVGGCHTPRFLGAKHQASDYPAKLTLDGTYAVPNTSVWTATPQAGSGVIGDATSGNSARLDFFLTERGVTRDRGAVQS